MLTGARRFGISLAAQRPDLPLDEALGQRRNRQEGIHAERARDHRAIGHREALVHAAIAREDAPERVHRALQVVVAHGAAAQRMRGDHVAQVEHAPRRVGNEVGAQGARVPPQFLVHAREDLLLPALVPGDADAPVGLGERSFEEDHAARVVLPHHQVEHGVVHGAVGIVRRRRWGRNRAPGGRAGRPRCRSRCPAAKQSEGGFGAIEVGIREAEKSSTAMRCASGTPSV